jgi:hypothetical protein
LPSPVCISAILPRVKAERAAQLHIEHSLAQHALGNDCRHSNQRQQIRGARSTLVQFVVAKTLIFGTKLVDSGDVAGIVPRRRKDRSQKRAHGLSLVSDRNTW